MERKYLTEDALDELFGREARREDPWLRFAGGRWESGKTARRSTDGDPSGKTRLRYVDADEEGGG